MMRIAFLSSEVAPYSKTGGLADVAGALPKFLAETGRVEVRVFTPLYREVRAKGLPLVKAAENVLVSLGGRRLSFNLYEHRAGNVTFSFIGSDERFDREFLYGTPAGDYPDNGERFGFFSRAALEAMKATGFRPDLVHGNDWQSAAAFAFLRFTLADDPFFSLTGSVFTIHNLAYQGLFEKEILAALGLPATLFDMNHLEFFGKVNFLKAGILYASAVTTVSRKYSREIQTPEFGCGLDGLLRHRSDVLFGILNGVDYEAWNPESDALIPANYGPRDLGGKTVSKLELLRLFGLPAEETKPVVGMVTRLAGQKGLDIVCEALEGVFKLGVRLVILGTGEKKIQEFLEAARQRYPEDLGLKIAFDEKLARTIYAGSDMFLIPSRYEPCGLTQMYSLKYGTIPVVRATGGLDDTIQEFEPATLRGNGFKFEAATPVALVEALGRAARTFSDRQRWRRLVLNAMAADFSWDRSARRYLELYETIIAMRGR
jgi:starch synthase